MKYRISVKLLQGQIYTYHVSSYKIISGDFVEFVDEKTGIVNKFHASNCEIKEVHE